MKRKEVIMNLIDKHREIKISEIARHLGITSQLLSYRLFKSYSDIDEKTYQTILSIIKELYNIDAKESLEQNNNKTEFIHYYERLINVLQTTIDDYRKYFMIFNNELNSCKEEINNLKLELHNLRERK